MRLILFTSLKCEDCNFAKKILEDAKDLEIIDIFENDEMKDTYKIEKVPTLVVEKCSGTEVYIGIEKIKKYVDEKGHIKGCGCGCHH